MEEKFQKIIKQGLIFSFILFLLFSCRKNKKNTVLDKAVELTENNEVIKDSLKKIKNKGIDFVVCFADLENEFNILSFNLVQEPNKRLFTYNVRNDFKIKTIEGVDVLFEDFNDKSIKSPKDIDKKSKELLDKKIISFDKKNTFIDCDFIEFIICKKDENKFKCFNTRMEIDKQNKMRKENKPYHRELFYPNCK
jgi:hypothetical protein